MSKIIIALFTSFAEAQIAVNDLLNIGIARTRISLLSPEMLADALQEHSHYDDRQEPSEPAWDAFGSVGSGLVDGTFGLLASICVLNIRGSGPILAAGPLAVALGNAMGGAYLGAAGSLFDALTVAGVPSQEAQLYSEGVQRGNSLVSVDLLESGAKYLKHLFLLAGAKDIHLRSADRYRDNQHDFKRYISQAFPASIRTAVIPRQQALPKNPLPQSFDAACPDAIDGMGKSLKSYPSDDRSNTETLGEGDSVWSRYELDFHENFERNYAPMGYFWKQYAPAYQYGYTLSLDKQYQHGNWKLCEAQIRNQWDESLYGSWERFKDPIRYAWGRTKTYLS
jgi:hypothetical protein